MSMELVLVLPIVIALVFGCIELGMLTSAGSTLKEASRAGCRVATLPGSSDRDVRLAVERVLHRPSLIKSCDLHVGRGRHTGDEVRVVVQVPMTAAAPDLLAMFGFGLGGRQLMAQTVMRKE